MKTKSSVLVAIAAVAVLTIVPALLHGNYVARWGEPAERATAAKALSDFPTQLGDWSAMVEGEPLTPRVERELGLAGYVSRVYRNPKSASEISILLMVGEAGPLVRHPPEICYGNRANEITSSSEVVVSPFEGGPESEFRVLGLKPNSQLTRPFYVAYAWSSENVWSVPSLPRVAFGGEPILYKVQIQMVQSELDPEDVTADLAGFLEEFVGAFSQFVGSTGSTNRA